jgi:peptidyl-prolyl cis-trans isomerase C
MIATKRMHAALLAACAAVSLTLLAGTGSLHAQQKAGDPVVAKVNGAEIRQSEVDVAEAEVGTNLPGNTPEAKRDALIAYLVDINLLAQAAEQKKMTQQPGFERKMELARKRVLMEAIMEQAVKDAASEAEMKKLYDESVKKMTPQEEVRASHILVETEEKAKELVAQLNKGADFAKLAKENSKDPGSADGGDLGYFTKDQMVPEFAEAAFKLDKGKISDPVKSQFGFHIIKVEDKRKQPAPAFADVKPQLEQFLGRKAQAELVAKLREGAKIERLDKAEAPADTKKN